MDQTPKTPVNSRISLLISLSIVFLLFIVTRYWVFYRANITYSDADHFHRNFASTWDIGIDPYKKVPFDYAPQSIPLMLTPHLVQFKYGIGHYYLNYRIIMFGFDLLLLIVILLYQLKQKPSWLNLLLVGTFYSAGGLIAQYYLYEGVDIPFILALVLALYILSIKKLKPHIKSLAFWFFFFMSTAIKFVTLPLVVPFAILKISSDNWKRELVWGGLAWAIVWGIPGAIYRSSLMVPLVIQSQRPLHLSSFPAYIVQTINAFTQTETLNFLEYHGPLTQKALHYSTIALAVGVVGLILWAIISKYRQKNIVFHQVFTSLSLVYLLWFSLAAKIFSPPFNLWLMVVLALIKFKSTKQQLIIYLVMLFIMIQNMTNWLDFGTAVFIYPLTWSFVRGLVRFVPIIILFGWSINQLYNPSRHE